ncbi:hypothetical protein CEE45_10350 [Candidatus Heimdallarchaeota archaeon B3_Heim]|nr:MAG: hypothetical protein CEE45_10350 [Candidatus Heimdallarchaeota archaeon B3_Heim]
MLGLSIINKTGILVFNHEFTSSYDEKIDEDLNAGLMSAIFSALRETQKETIKSIRLRDNYVFLLYEGVLTYGVLSTTEEDSRQYNFLREVVLKFEIMYTKELHQETVIERYFFNEFHVVVKKMYSDMVEIDVAALNNLINVMGESKIRNYLIYETKYFHPVFRSITDSIVNEHADKMTQIFRYIIDFSEHANQAFSTGELNFETMRIFTVKTKSHCIAIFDTSTDRGKGSMKKELIQLQKKII